MSTKSPSSHPHHGSQPAIGEAVPSERTGTDQSCEKRRVLPVVTPSNCEDLDCPLKFHSLHECRLTQPYRFTVAGAFGSAIHKVLRRVYDPRMGTPPHDAHIASWSYEAVMEQGYPDPAVREEDIARCEKIVRSYIKQDEDAVNVIGVEVPVGAVVEVDGVPKFAVRARADRLVVRPSEPDRLVVQDYKIHSEHSPRPIHVRKASVLAAASFYSVASPLQGHRFQDIQVELEWITSVDGRVQRDTLPLSRLAPAFRHVRASAARYAGLVEYAAEPGEACMGCPLRSTCPAIRESRISPEGMHAFFHLGDNI